MQHNHFSAKKRQEDSCAAPDGGDNIPVSIWQHARCKGRESFLQQQH